MTIIQALIIILALLLGILLLACVLLPDVDNMADVWKQVQEWLDSLDKEGRMQFDVVLA